MINVIQRHIIYAVDIGPQIMFCVSSLQSFPVDKDDANQSNTANTHALC
jgi:hypothetical protein